jgi:hypothetical protein
MNNKELLFNLIKKLESGEIGFFSKMIPNPARTLIAYCLKNKQNGEEIYLSSEVFGINRYEEYEYREEYNKEFKENFYQEKGLDKCWVKDCPNKIYQTENDYKKVKIPCQDKHTRMICLECSKNYE